MNIGDSDSNANLNKVMKGNLIGCYKNNSHNIRLSRQKTFFKKRIDFLNNMLNEIIYLNKILI